MTLLAARAAYVSRRPARAFVKAGRAREAGQSRGQRSLSHVGSARRTREQRTGGHGLANTGCVAKEVTDRDPPRPGLGPSCRIGAVCRLPRYRLSVRTYFL